MPLPELIQQMVQRKLEDFCEERIPAQLRNKVRLGFRFRGNSVTLYEERPHFIYPERWVDIVIAQFRYDVKSGKWTLYCADRNSRWRLYYFVEPTKNFDLLLQEVSKDPTCIFWG